MLATAAFFNSRQRHPQLPRAQSRIGMRHVECAGKPNRAGKTSKHALRDVKGGLALMWARGGLLHSRDQQRVASDYDLHRIGLDADQIQYHFDAARRFDDIDSNAAFRGMRARVHSGELCD
jgi:hypothetical protein